MQDMMETKEYLLAVVAAALHGEAAPSPPATIDWAKLYRLAARNAVQALLYLALLPQRDALSPDCFLRLEKAYKAALMREVSQQELLKNLRRDLHAQDIDFLLLKGTHLKALYPSAEMRFMVDMDLLVHTKDLARAKTLLCDYGLSIDFDNGKDIVFIKKPFLTVELHRTLFQKDDAMYAYFLGVWDKAVPLHTHEFQMTPNDLFVYTLAHLAEHYTSAGSCFRPMMDLYLMEKKQAELLDFDYINAQLTSLELTTFATHVRALGKAMFDSAEKDDTLLMMENYITLGPPVQNAAAASAAARTKKSKAALLFAAAFPGLRHMRLKYPILKKAGFLLPVFWLVRLVQYAFTKDEGIANKRNSLKNSDAKSAETLQKIFERSGL